VVGGGVDMGRDKFVRRWGLEGGEGNGGKIETSARLVFSRRLLVIEGHGMIKKKKLVLASTGAVDAWTD